MVSDQEFVNFLKAGGENAKRVQEKIFKDQKYFAFSRKVIQEFSRRGYNFTREQAEALYPESMCVFFKKVAAPDFELTSALSTFYYSIAQMTWLNIMKKRDHVFLDLNSQSEIQEEGTSDTLIEEETYSICMKIIEKTGETCKILLTQLQEGFKHEEIMRMLGYQSKDAFRQMRFKCRLKLRELLNEQPEWKPYLRFVELSIKK